MIQTEYTQQDYFDLHEAFCQYIKSAHHAQYGIMLSNETIEAMVRDYVAAWGKEEV